MPPTVRLLRDDELVDAVTVPGQAMLADIALERRERWAERWRGAHNHGAFRDDGALVGTARWFETQLMTTGEALDAAAVTSVGVLPQARRQGHLTRLMEAQLQHAVDHGRSVAVLIAAEYPIYGRFGYGPAASTTDLRIDRHAAVLVDPPSGTLELVEAEAFRDGLEVAYAGRWARTPGAITRPADFLSHIAGLQPGQPFAGSGFPRWALWRDDQGRVLGAVTYVVEERWEHYRPLGKATVHLLVGATAEAERELWRHLLSLDWIATIEAQWRPVDDPLPLWLTDARTVARTTTSDVFWARVLDVPTTIAALRRPSERGAVLEVADDLGHAAGRWAVTIGPDGASAASTDATADVRLPARALGAALLGGTSLVKLHEVGWVDEESIGGVARSAEVFASATQPWAPADF